MAINSNGMTNKIPYLGYLLYTVKVLILFHEN